MPEIQADYFQPGYPTLSFCYALYCSGDWTVQEFAKWRAALPNPQPDPMPEDFVGYRGFLDNYIKDVNDRVPADVEDVSASWKRAIGVPTNGPNSKGEFAPTPAQARIGTRAIFAELAKGTALNRVQGRDLAVFKNQRPVLSVLAQIYLNQQGDPHGAIAADIDGIARIDAETKAALKALIPGNPGVKPALWDGPNGAAVKKKVEGAIVDEFIDFPWIW